MENGQPTFLRGTFSWEELGYQFAGAPAPDLFKGELLESSNWWFVLASVLEFAKRGDHSHVPKLERWIRAEEDYFRVCATSELFGDAARQHDLRILKDIVQKGPDRARVAACRAAYWSGYLWLVPTMLEAWNLVEWRDDKEIISYMLSDLLEDEAGPLIANEGYSASEYSRLVLSLVEELSSTYQTDEIPVFEGRLFGVTSMTKRYYELLSSDIPPSEIEEDFIDYRHKFEAATGINCTSFLENGEFQPLATAAILEEFLESPEAEKYEEGVRYFWGHRIPDQ